MNNIINIINKLLMPITNNEKIINFIINSQDTKLEITNLEDMEDLINKDFEILTGCKIYNKSNLLKEIDDNFNDNINNFSNLLNCIKKNILKNIIVEIDFNTIFRTNLDFSLIFTDNDVNILYKNKRINDITMLNDISKDLIETKKDYLPCINKLYIDTIIVIIKSFINKNLLVKYNCLNIPLPYWNLFEIKCKKCKEIIQNNDEYYTNIIRGKKYEINEEIKPLELQEVPKPIKLSHKNNIADDHYRMEVLSYLNDTEVINFLTNMEKLDKLENAGNKKSIEYINNYIDKITGYIHINNEILKLYYVYKIFNIILLFSYNNTNTISDTIKQFISKLLNNIPNELYIIKTAELKLYDILFELSNKIAQLITTPYNNINITPHYIQNNNIDSW